MTLKGWRVVKPQHNQKSGAMRIIATVSVSDDVNFLLSFLPICAMFDFTSEQEETIFTL